MAVIDVYNLQKEKASQIELREDIFGVPTTSQPASPCRPSLSAQPPQSSVGSRSRLRWTQVSRRGAGGLGRCWRRWLALRLRIVVRRARALIATPFAVGVSARHSAPTVLA